MLCFFYLFLAKLSRAQQSTVGKKVWLSMQPRHFGSDKIVRPSVRPYVRPPLHVRWNEILHFKHPARFGGKLHGHLGF